MVKTLAALFLLLPALDLPPLPGADTAQARWLADLDPARFSELAVRGPLPAAGRLQSFSLLVPLPGATLCVSGAEV